MKERDVIQGLEQLWGKAPLPADFRDVISTPATSAQDQDYEELEEFEDDKEKRGAREIIQGLQELWGKASLPADFRDVIPTPDWQHSSRGSSSGRVISMVAHRRKRELIQSSLSLGGVLAACLVLVLSWSLKENATDNDAVVSLVTTIKESQVALRDTTYRLAWVTSELAQNRVVMLISSDSPDSKAVEDVRENFLLAGQHFKRASELGTEQIGRADGWYEAALAYQDGCHFENAIILLQEVVDQESNKRGKAKALFALGAISQLLGEYSKAISQYETAFDLSVTEARDAPQGSDERRESEKWQERAVFNSALVHAALFAKNKVPQHLQNTLTALKKSIDIGGRKRVGRIQEVQERLVTENTLCPDFPWVEDLSMVAEEPAFKDFLEKQLQRRWL